MSDVPLEQLIARLPTGRLFAISAHDLASEMQVSERKVGQLVERAIIERGYAIGSRCDERPGYFLIADAEDARVGVAHIVARGRSIFQRVSALQANVERVLNEAQPTLFDLQREAS